VRKNIVLFLGIIIMDSFYATNILSGTALCACFIFSGLIFFSKIKNGSQKLFSIFLLLIGSVLFYFLLLDFERNDIGIILLPFFMAIVLSLGPILWFYVKSVIGERSKKLANIFIVPLVFFTLIIILFGLKEIATEPSVKEAIVKILQYVVMFGLSLVFLAQNIFFIYKCFSLYKSHQFIISNSYSYTEKVNLSWLKVLIFGYIFFISGLILAHLVDDYWSYYLFYTTILIYVFFSGYHALTQSPIEKFEGIVLEEKEIKKIDLKTDFFIQLKKNLIKLMEEETLYLNSTLNIQELSNKLNTNNKYLSTLINQEFQMNFVSFVNSYRIAEAKKLLLDSSKYNLTIEAIGNESGFKSKSAFNVAFKKVTELTPSAFVKQFVQTK